MCHHVSPCVFRQQLSDEALGQFTCAAEEFFIKLIVHAGNVCHGLLFRLAQKWGSTTQSEGVKIILVSVHI